MATIAIIPARAGSKRLKNKNSIDLCGKPLIAWTIEAALKSNLIDKVIVSTNSNKIAEIGRQYGAEVPFKRPAILSSDTATSFDVIKHVLDFYNTKFAITKIVLLQPTSPLRATIDIDNAIKQLDANTKAVVSVCEVSHSPLWMNTLPSDLSLQYFLKNKNKNKRSQDLEKYYMLNGAVYVSEVNYFLKEKGFFGKNSKALIMPKERSVDIDTKLDLMLCKLLLTNA